MSTLIKTKLQMIFTPKIIFQADNCQPAQKPQCALPIPNLLMARPRSLFDRLIQKEIDDDEQLCDLRHGDSPRKC